VQAQNDTQLLFAETRLAAFQTAANAIKDKLSTQDAKRFEETLNKSVRSYQR
jgi:hypothetical protein